MTPTNKHQKQGKSQSWTFSKTSNANYDKQQQQQQQQQHQQKQKQNELEEEIRKLKTTQNITETKKIDKTKMNNPPQQNSKNGNPAFATEASKKTSTYST